MPEAGNSGSAGWVLVARRVTLRGAKGLLTARLVNPGSPALSPFGAGQRLLFRKGEQNREHLLERAESYRDRVVLELRGVDTADAAAPLAGSDILLESKDLVDLPEGSYYICHLVGLDVIGPGNRFLGKVLEIVRTGGTDLLRVGIAGGRELLIPFARSICRRVDIAAGRIEIDPPEGLLEIDAV
jgi:16S rRNA processing protein RimM